MQQQQQQQALVVEEQTPSSPSIATGTTRTPREMRNQLDPIVAEEMLASTLDYNTSEAALAGCPLENGHPNANMIDIAWKTVPIYTSDAALRAARPKLFWNRPVNAHNSEFENHRHAGVWLFHNAVVYGEETVVMDCTTMLIPTSCYSPPSNKNSNKKKRPDLPSQLKVINGTAVLLYQYWINSTNCSTG